MTPFLDTRLLSTCNGLVCLSGPQSYLPLETYVCNPFTKEYITLPEIKTDSDSGSDSDDVVLWRSHDYVLWRSGFGFGFSTNEYKVVRIMLKTKFLEVYIYTLGSGNGWRNLGMFNFGSKDWGEGIFSNGLLYWLDFGKRMIVTFDLAKEKYCGQLSPPPLPPDSSWFYDRIWVFEGFVFLAVGQDVEGANWYDIWLLEKKNDTHGMEEREEHQSLGWRQEFRIDDSKLFAVMKTDDVLTYTDYSLNIYDPKASTSKMLVDFDEWITRVLPHKNTLVSLKKLGEEDTKVAEPIEIRETENHAPSFNYL